MCLRQQVNYSVISQGHGWKSLAVTSPDGRMPHARLVRRAKAREAAAKASGTDGDDEPEHKKPKLDEHESAEPSSAEMAKPVAARVKVYFTAKSEDGEGKDKHAIHVSCSYEVVDREKLNRDVDMQMNVFQLVKNCLTGVYDK
jgi:hypothetical protein